VSEEADPLNLLTDPNSNPQRRHVAASCPGRAASLAACAGKGGCEMDEKRSATRRSGAERRTSERRIPTFHHRFAAGPGPPPRSRERRKGLRRLEYRRKVSNRRAAA